MTLKELAMEILNLPAAAQENEAIFWNGKSEGPATCYVTVDKIEHFVTHLDHGDGTFTYNKFDRQPDAEADVGEDLFYPGDYYLTKELL